MSAHYSQWQHARGNGGPVQRAPSGGKGGWSVWLFTVRSPGGYTRHSGNYACEEGIAWENDVIVGGVNPHQAFVLLKNAFAIPKLQYVLRASPAYLCREELRIFDRALFYSLWRVVNMSLGGGDVCKQAGFPVGFGCLSCRRARDIALPSFIASMNSVGELVWNYSF